MKRTLFILVLTCIVSFLHAQNSNKPKTYLWGMVGATGSTLIERISTDKSAVYGQQVAIALRTHYPTKWGYEIGGYYASKGTQFNDPYQKIHLDYAGAYINSIFFFPLQNNDDVTVGAGFYFASAINGKAKTDSTNEKIDFGETWKSFDAGVQMKVGYSIKNLIALSIHYDVGFLKVYESLDPRGKPNKANNSSFSLNAGLNISKLLGKK